MKSLSIWAQDEAGLWHRATHTFPSTTDTQCGLKALKVISFSAPEAGGGRGRVEKCPLCSKAKT